MDKWVRIKKKRVAVIIMSFFLLLFSSSFVYGQWWDSVNPPSVSSSWSLSGVHFTSATEGWAVGYDGTNGSGVLLHYSWGTWISVSPPFVSSSWDLQGVHFTSPNKGWAVGGDYANGRGVLLRYSMGKWTSVTPPDVSSEWSLSGVHFTSPNFGWAVGYDRISGRGLLLHYSKGKWTSVNPPYVSSDWQLFGVHFTSPGEGWAVGFDNEALENPKGGLLHYLGGTWTSVDPPSVGPGWGLFGVHFSSPTEGWAVGRDNADSKGVLLHYSGGDWTPVTPPTVSSNWWSLNGVHFTSATEGWAVGYDVENIETLENQKGVLLHYLGGTWTSETAPSVSSTWTLDAVHFTSVTEGWAVGYDVENQKGLLLHYSIWPMTSSSKLNIKGWAKGSDLLYGSCHIKPDGTFLLPEDDHGTPRSYTGTYIITPDGKGILFTLDSNGLSAMEAMLTDWVLDLAGEEGVDVQNISFTFEKVTISKGRIQKKTNAPSKVTIKITGTVTALVDGNPETARFTYQSNLKYYSLSE